jgi:hypothetical protein
VQLFTRKSGRNESPFGASLDLIARLDPAQRIAVARGLAMLWEAFVGRFGGLAGFIEADGAVQAAYFGEMRAAAEKMSKSNALVSSRYSLSPALMATYLEALARGDSTAAARQFGQAVIVMLEQGAKLRSRSQAP